MGAAANADKFISGNLRCKVGLIALGRQAGVHVGNALTLLSIPFQTVATIGNYQFGLQSCAIQPGHSMVMTIWQPTTFTTGVTYELEFGYLEEVTWACLSCCSNFRCLWREIDSSHGYGWDVCATNPTAGTGIVTGVAVTLAAAATAPSMVVVNNNAPNRTSTSTRSTSN